MLAASQPLPSVSEGCRLWPAMGLLIKNNNNNNYKPSNSALNISTL